MVRPTSFMENIPPRGVARFFFLGTMAAVFGQSKVYHIACEDIGKAAARALLKPKAYQGRIVTLVGEKASVDQMQRALGQAEGYTPWRAWLPGWLVLMLTPTHFNQMFKVRLPRSVRKPETC